MMISSLAVVAFLFASIPTFVFFRNIAVFRRLPNDSQTPTAKPSNLPRVSVLIPARNEENAIGPCIESVLTASGSGLDVEVVVLDDHSEDATADRVRKLSQQDPRVRLESANPLPTGWCGKQHACAQLAELAQHELLIFLDADVRLSNSAVIRMAYEYTKADVGLLSGFPRQRTESPAEQLLIPLIHFVLLGFLSLRRMRGSTHPAFGAGCGQLFITSKTAYARSGGHAQIRRSLHDGLKLPRLYREHGMATDLFDGTDIASCRMYYNAREVWDGLKKNATEGVANPKLIVPVTAILLLGQVLPFVLLVLVLTSMVKISALTWVPILLACGAALLPRILSAFRYQQPILGALFHPVAIVCFLLIQWSAFVGSFSKRTVSWKGRPYPA